MKKFDSFLEKYLIEAELTLTPNIVSTARKGIENAPSSVKDALNAVSSILDPDNTGKAGELHKKLSDIINPNTKTNIKDLNPEEQTKAIEILTKAGFPISIKNDNDSEDSEKETDKTQSQQTTQNQTSISNSTNYSA